MTAAESTALEQLVEIAAEEFAGALRLHPVDGEVTEDELAELADRIVETLEEEGVSLTAPEARGYAEEVGRDLAESMSDQGDWD